MMMNTITEFIIIIVYANTTLFLFAFETVELCKNSKSSLSFTGPAKHRHNSALSLID